MLEIPDDEIAATFSRHSRRRKTVSVLNMEELFE